MRQGHDVVTPFALPIRHKRGSLDTVRTCDSCMNCPWLRHNSLVAPCRAIGPLKLEFPPKALAKYHHDKRCLSGEFACVIRSQRGSARPSHISSSTALLGADFASRRSRRSSYRIPTAGDQFRSLKHARPSWSLTLSLWDRAMLKTSSRSWLELTAYSPINPASRSSAWE